MVAGDDDDPPGQRHRPGADDPERARRHEVRRLVSGVVPRRLRRERGERSGHPACAGRVRMVRDSDVDRRAGVERAAGRRLARVGGRAWQHWIAFGIFWIIQVGIIIRGLEGIKILESWSAPLLLGGGGLLLWWAIDNGGGLGRILAESSRLQTTQTPFWQLFPAALTANVGYWATLSLNIPDFTRYAKSQRSQALGQAIGLPPTMTAFAFIGVAVTSATIVIFGEAIWDPVVLIARIGSPAVIIFGALVVLIAQLTTNMAANVVSPANDFSSLAPRRISYVAGGLITAVIGILMMPWKLYADAAAYIFTWLIGYSSLMGAIGGVLIADYWVLRGRELSAPDLFKLEGRYTYSGGVNYRAMAAMALAILPVVPGFIRAATTPGGQVANPSLLDSLYTYAWFVTFGLSFVLYLLMSRSERHSRIRRSES